VLGGRGAGKTRLGENLHRRASTAFLVRSMFALRTLVDGDFLFLDWRAAARVRFVIAKLQLV
jgi:hypothetical protein